MIQGLNVLHITFTDQEYNLLKKYKKDFSWHDFLIELVKTYKESHKTEKEK